MFLRVSVPRNSDFPRYSDFFPADGRSHYIEERLYLHYLESIILIIKD